MSEIVASFSPFETNLDYTKTLKLLNNGLDGSIDGELFLEETKSESLSLDDGN